MFDHQPRICQSLPDTSVASLAIAMTIRQRVEYIECFEIDVLAEAKNNVKH
jgi:hypothetical protein